MTKRNVLVSAKQLDLGWYGTDEGRTVRFEFFADGRRAGTLVVSAARIRWKGPRKEKGKIYKTTELDKIFRTYDNRRR